LPPSRARNPSTSPPAGEPACSDRFGRRCVWAPRASSGLAILRDGRNAIETMTAVAAVGCPGSSYGKGIGTSMKIAVFCGSNVGKSDVYRDGAAALGRTFAQQNIELVFGGTSKGLMKIVADAVVQGGGTVRGVIPQTLVDKGQQYPGLTIAEVVATRALRKARMAAVADGFVAMPGGIGTIEELFEMWVDAQFEGHTKPLGLYNLDGFFDHLLLFVDAMIERGFLPPQQKAMIIVASDPAVLLERFRTFTPVIVSKWM
jgi:uncharacterized protein (TIGR00730 family)